MRKEEIRHDIIVIGGGAAGFMAAVAAARAGADVVILEHTDKTGKKLLATGNGRCNITNLLQEKGCYRSNSQDRAWQTVQAFPAADTLAFFRDMGLVTKDRSGYVYPCSNQAASVLRVWRSELRRLGVPVCYRTELTEIRKTESGFCGETKDRIYRSRCLILAAGSRAAEKTGSDGSGYRLAGQLGHSLLPVLPALTPLTARESCFKRLAGIRVEGKITLYLEDEPVAADAGELQLTEYGISGIPAFQVSRYASEGLYRGKNVRACLDFCPSMGGEELTGFLERQRRQGKRIGEALCGILHETLAQVLMERSGITEDKGRREPQPLDRLAGLVKCFPAEITGTRGFDQCQVCMGGVPLTEVNPDTMESLVTQGLYLAGEILDVDGICGGYNLQWAWSSGYLAGTAAARSGRNGNRKGYIG